MCDNCHSLCLPCCCDYWPILYPLLPLFPAALAHYGEGEWDWLRGAMCTVDRSYGKLLDHCFHHIADTHVAHHLFSQMPHYHAQEATVHIKRVLGEYYQKDDRNVFQAFWEETGSCAHVEPEDAGEKIYWFKS